MLRKILSYGFVEAIAKGLNKLILLLLPFFLISEDFGKIGLIISIETLLPLITLLGFERVILRFYAYKDNYPNLDKTISKSILYTHLFVFSLFLLLGGIGVESFLGLAIKFDWLLIIILVYLQGVNSLVLNKLRVNESHVEYFKARLFLSIGKFVLIIAIVFFSKNYTSYLFGGILIAFLSNVIFKVNNVSINEIYDKKTFKTIFLFSWPFIFHGISMNLLGNADKFIIDKFLTLNDVGLYTFAYSIGSMVVFAYIGVSIYLEPIIYKSKNDIEKELLLKKFNFIALGSGLISYFFICIASFYIIPIFYDDTYVSIVSFIPHIALAHLLFPYYLSANYRMVYDKKTLNIALASIISCLISIGLNFFFIPIYGLYAAVIVTILSYLLQALGFVFVSNKYRFTLELIEILMLSIILLIGVFYDIHFFFITIIISTYLFLLFRFKM